MVDRVDTRAERLAAALDDFIYSSPDVEAAAVVSFDGLPMASALPEDLEEDRVGAMSAALLSLGEQAAIGLGRGQLNQVFVEGDHGFVFLMSARDQAVLAAIARRTAKIGFMLFEMRRAAERIGTALGAEPAMVTGRSVAMEPAGWEPDTEPDAAEAAGEADVDGGDEAPRRDDAEWGEDAARRDDAEWGEDAARRDDAERGDDAERRDESAGEPPPPWPEEAEQQRPEEWSRDAGEGSDREPDTGPMFDRPSIGLVHDADAARP